MELVGLTLELGTLEELLGLTLELLLGFTLELGM
jgi:hypothetical protein